MFLAMLQSSAGDVAQGAVNGVTTLLPVADWIAIAVVLTGLVLGTLAGLARSFGMLLWLLAALWLARQLAGTVVGWLPNSAAPTTRRRCAPPTACWRRWCWRCRSSRA